MAEVLAEKAALHRELSEAKQALQGINGAVDDMSRELQSTKERAASREQVQSST